MINYINAVRKPRLWRFLVVGRIKLKLERRKLSCERKDYIAPDYGWNEKWGFCEHRN